MVSDIQVKLQLCNEHIQMSNVQLRIASSYFIYNPTLEFKSFNLSELNLTK